MPICFSVALLWRTASSSLGWWRILIIGFLPPTRPSRDAVTQVRSFEVVLEIRASTEPLADAPGAASQRTGVRRGGRRAVLAGQCLVPATPSATLFESNGR